MCRARVQEALHMHTRPRREKSVRAMINPKDLIHSLSIEELCRTAEAYYKSIPDPTPQLAKPFSSLLEGPDQLQSMGLLLSGLRLGKTMSVLEFGAGTCWF